MYENSFEQCSRKELSCFNDKVDDNKGLLLRYITCCNSLKSCLIKLTLVKALTLLFQSKDIKISVAQTKNDPLLKLILKPK